MTRGDDPDPRELGRRTARYDKAGPLARAAMRLTGEAPSPLQRELLRRRELGPEGRLAEDVVRAVRACDEVWGLLAEKDLPEDVTMRELDALASALLGRPTLGWREDTDVSVSIRFDGRPLHLLALRNLIPGDTPADAFDGYRYATLTQRGGGAVEPFIVALQSRRNGDNAVVAAMLVAPTFLRHEQEFGAISAADVTPLEDVVTVDLQDIARTLESLRRA